MTRMSIGVAVAVAVGAGNVAFAQSRCDSTITRAAGKKAACKAGVISKAQKSGGAPDAAKLAKCEAKFANACGKGQAAGDCVVQTASCAEIEGTVDACVTTLMGSAAPTTTTTTSTSTTSTTVPPPCCDPACDPGDSCVVVFMAGSTTCQCIAASACSLGTCVFQPGGVCDVAGCPPGYSCFDHQYCLGLPCTEAPSSCGCPAFETCFLNVP